MKPGPGDDPDIVVVYGSESRLLSTLFELPWRFIRLYNRTVPMPRGNCRDVGSIAELDAAADPHGLLRGADDRRSARGHAGGLPRKIALGRMGRGTKLVSAMEFAMRNRYLNSGVLDLDGGIGFD